MNPSATLEAAKIPEDIRKMVDDLLDLAISSGDDVSTEQMMARAILEDRERSQWQPIETAPTGAKGVAWMMLAYGPEGDQTTGMGMRFHDKFYAASTFYVGGHSDGRQFKFQEHEVHPTHWMPEPNVPAAPKGGEA